MHIFILEDDMILRRALMQLFTSRGHQVHAAENSSQAETIVSSGISLDMMLCDVMVPGVSGPALLMKVKKEIRKQMPVIIIMSSLADGENFIRKLGIQYDHFLVKPLNFEQLARLTDEIAKTRMP